MFGRRHPLVDVVHKERTLNHYLSIPTSFDSVMQAKSYLDFLISGVFRLQGDLMAIAEDAASLSGHLPLETTRRQCYVQALSRSVDLGPDLQQIMSRKQVLEAGVAAFWKALEAFVRNSTDSEDRTVMAIRIQHLLVLFTVTNCRETYEITCDGFYSLFESTIDLAEKYIHTTQSFEEIPQHRKLSLEPGIIPTIQLIASKCREPVTRRRAIRLLRDGCMQEAIWDGTPFATFMQRLAELEEAQMSMSGSIASPLLIEKVRVKQPIPTIPEHTRFTDVAVAAEPYAAGYGRLVCARYRHESDGMIEITEHHVNLVKFLD